MQTAIPAATLDLLRAEIERFGTALFRILGEGLCQALADANPQPVAPAIPPAATASEIGSPEAADIPATGDRRPVDMADDERRMRTPARRAILEREYPRFTDTASIAEAMNQLPGRPVTILDISVWASHAGLSRARHASLAAHGDSGDIVEAIAASSSPRVFKRTAARLEILLREYPAGTHLKEIARMMNALPGGVLSDRGVKDWAKEVRVHRPGWENPGRTPERRVIVARDYPAGIALGDILRAVNALPGRPLQPVEIGVWASDMGLCRPKIAVPAHPIARSPAPATAPAPRPGYVVAPPPKSAVQVSRESDAAMIARHLATKGVTRCPTAFLEPTSAPRVPEDAAAIRAHTESQNAARQGEIQARIDRNKLSRTNRLMGRSIGKQAHAL